MKVVTEVGAILGEGPIWHAADQAIYWVDILGRRVFRHDPATGDTSVVHEGEQVTALAETDRGGLLLVTRRGLMTLEDGAVGQVAGIDLPEGVRTNDGKCDPWGRVWFGTMDLDQTRPVAELFRFDGTMTTAVSGLTLSNGVGWSPAGDRFYHVDSIPGLLHAYDHDPATGAIANPRVIADFTGSTETPDGLAVDSDGNIWLALWDGSAITIRSPDGTEVHRVHLPMRRPTCVVFGGENLDVLYVTSATEGLTEEDLVAQPAAGELLALDPGTRGIAGGVFTVP